MSYYYYAFIIRKFLKVLKINLKKINFKMERIHIFHKNIKEKILALLLKKKNSLNLSEIEKIIYPKEAFGDKEVYELLRLKRL